MPVHPYKCKNCSHVCSSLSALTDHWKNAHPKEYAAVHEWIKSTTGEYKWNGDWVHERLFEGLIPAGYHLVKCPDNIYRQRPYYAQE